VGEVGNIIERKTLEQDRFTLKGQVREEEDC
jgi:hypothetical protein